MLYMVTFTINIPPMLAYIPYMDPMANRNLKSFKQQNSWWMNIWMMMIFAWGLYYVVLSFVDWEHVMTVMIDSLWSPPGFRNLSGYIQKTLRMEITERLVSPDLTCHDMEGFVDGFHRCLPKISRCQVFLVHCTLRTPTAGTIAIALQT